MSASQNELNFLFFHCSSVPFSWKEVEELINEKERHKKQSRKRELKVSETENKKFCNNFKQDLE